MEDKSTTPSHDYIDGFNEGYLVSQHMPDISDKLASALGETDRGTGFRNGKAQFGFEQEKAKYPSWLQRDRLSNPSKIIPDKNIHKDKD